MRGKLSVAESRYRVKLIQEKHYDKKKQKELDMFAEGKKGIYKEIYQAHRNKKTHLFFVIQGLGTFLGALGDFTTSVGNAGKAFQNMSKIISKFYS